MPTIIDCPSCRRQLRVPDNLAGHLVKCPTCGTTFTAPDPAAAAPAPAPRPPEPAPPQGFRLQPEEAPPPRPRPRPPADEDDGRDDFDYEPRRRRRDLRPHQGVLILVLGILSLVLSCFPLGI